MASRRVTSEGELKRTEDEYAPVPDSLTKVVKESGNDGIGTAELEYALLHYPFLSLEEGGVSDPVSLIPEDKILDYYWSMPWLRPAMELRGLPKRLSNPKLDETKLHSDHLVEDEEESSEDEERLDETNIYSDYFGEDEEEEKPVEEEKERVDETKIYSDYLVEDDKLFIPRKMVPSTFQFRAYSVDEVVEKLAGQVSETFLRASFTKGGRNADVVFKRKPEEHERLGPYGQPDDDDVVIRGPDIPYVPYEPPEGWKTLKASKKTKTNGYCLFMRYMGKETETKGSINELMRIFDKDWKALPDEEKQMWKLRAKTGYNIYGRGNGDGNARARTLSPSVPSTSSTTAFANASSTPAVPSTSSTTAVATTSSTPAVPTTSSTPAVPTTSSTPAVPSTSSTTGLSHEQGLDIDDISYYY